VPRRVGELAPTRMHTNRGWRRWIPGAKRGGGREEEGRRGGERLIKDVKVNSRR